MGELWLVVWWKEKEKDLLCRFWFCCYDDGEPTSYALIELMYIILSVVVFLDTN